MEIKNRILKNTQYKRRQDRRKEGMKTRWSIYKTSSKRIDLNLTTWIITLNVKGINTPIKRQKLLNWTKKQDLSVTYKKPTLNIKTHVI